MNEPVIGRVCTSRAGHDKGRAFLIVGVFDDNHVLLSDGETRKLSRPKKKKLSHLHIEPQKTDEIAKKFAESKEVLDADVRNALKLFGYNNG
ncbi:MAG TPA: KOW domain-containing RNA-binding protein [Clostridia bacterium]|jgi:ribosomal protein L14E/L6E/L27E|nr:KOW domain-containing RNA-binding protein [Clostridia bacterium]